MSQFDTILQSQKASSFFVLTDENLVSYYPQFIHSLRQNHASYLQIIPAGEIYKSWLQAETIFRQMMRLQLDRKSILVVFGGGVLSDLGGYCASQYLRGIPYLLIPTTLLAQVDACIGGKVAINFENTKNLLGHFYPPQQVWIDPNFIQTLPAHQIRSGLGEIIKYGMIGPFFLLEQLLSISWEEWKEKHLLETIRLCLETKKALVEADEFEAGPRAILNFGHTLGHALESTPSFLFTHGEAVALGMLVITQFALEQNFLKDPTVLLKLQQCLQRFQFPLQMSVSKNDLEKYLSRDKKNVRQSLNLVLPTEKGKVQPACVVEIQALLHWIEKRSEHLQLH